MKFSHLYENLKLLDICKPVSKEEAEKRDIEGPAIRLKEKLNIDTIKKTKLSDGTWHIHGDLDVSECRLPSLKVLNINISIVDGDFNCSDNRLTSLEGCPKDVKGNFFCHGNRLTSLEGCPKEVKGNFVCHGNRLTSLEGCPKEVKGNFTCANNKLTSLTGCPKIVLGSFYCDDNKLISLEGCPINVGRNFWCNNNSKTFTRNEVNALCNVKGEIYV